HTSSPPPPLPSFPTRRSSDLIPAILATVPEPHRYPMPHLSPVAVLLTLVAAPLTPALLAGQETPTERSAAAGVIRRMNDLERSRSEEHTSELQSRVDLVCRLL